MKETAKRRILLIHRDPYLVQTRTALLEANGYSVEAAYSIDEARTLCRDLVCDLVIIDSGQSRDAALELCEEIKQYNPELSVAIVAWYNTPVESECPDQVIRREDGPKGFLAGIESLV